MAKKSTRGFTIVELLIVIVVIAILAAITIVAYNGVQARARASQASTALSQAKRKLELYKVDNSAYPTTANLANAGIADADTDYQYTSDGTTYCLTATAVTISYYLNSTTQATPTAGGCAGHGQGGVAAITNLVTNPSLETNTTTWGLFSSGGTVVTSRQSLGAVSGTMHYRVAWTTSATSKGGGCYPANIGAGEMSGGVVYSLSMWLRSNVDQLMDLHAEWKNSSLALISTSYGPVTSLTANTWTRVSVTATAPAGTYAVTFPAYGSATGHMWQAGEYVDCDAAMLTAGSTLYDYADGASPNWAWTSTANASTSTGPPL